MHMILIKIDFIVLNFSFLHKYTAKSGCCRDYKFPDEVISSSVVMAMAALSLFIRN